ncbi:hypothetical protein MNBD_GAMMA23-2172 [hydrothermal vent metagenome]|uniref:DUF4124 domain-containing protein n=1 Tax=hydrothermal vent metagenome TaxID=652676 RepID=A0A3B1A3D8_9ZZZZ
MTIKILVALVFSFLSLAAEAKIYKWVDEDGLAHFSQEKPAHLKENFTNKATANTARLKSFLYPFGSSAILKGSKKVYCNKAAALNLLRSKISRKKRELAQYENLYATKALNRKPVGGVYSQKLRVEQEIYEEKLKLTNKSSRQRFLSNMQKKCIALKKNKIVDKEVYNIGSSGYKRVFKKKDREYIGYIGIGITKYPSSHNAKSKWYDWNRKSNQKKYIRVEKKKLNGMPVLLMSDKADFAVGFILLDTVLIEIQFGSKRFVEFEQFQYFIQRYTRWLAKKF